MSSHLRVEAADGADFYRQIAVFAYGSYLEDGFGAVVISQGEFCTHGDGRVEAVLSFVPYADDAGLFPPRSNRWSTATMPSGNASSRLWTPSVGRRA